ncbi:MAG TPA: SprT family zinc-dependent metalloprotease, partial [Steroidobacteraceae bacterium]|nr:SprT family zinc-dependent metalloprotease [Steroidobacteraceae bacterium]
GPGWHVRISRRARRLSMKVFPGGRIEVVVPPGVGVPAVEQFVSRHREWAERRARELQSHAPLAAERQPESVRLALIERRWEVEYREGRRSRVVQAGEGRLAVTTPQRTDRQVGSALGRWLAGVALEAFEPRLDALAREVGIGYQRLAVRRQRTRWGSCSSTGTISLNVCLLFQRPQVVRYLMVHELSHVRHMNHSGRFWALVQALEPDWRSLDRELLQGWRHVPAWVFA